MKSSIGRCVFLFLFYACVLHVLTPSFVNFISFLKIFSDIDTIQEAEMLHLANFMKILLEKVSVPASPKDTAQDSSDTLPDGAPVPPPPRRMKRVQSVVNIEDLDLAGIGATANSALRKEEALDIGDDVNIDLTLAREVLELFRRGGKVSTKLLLRVVNTARDMFAALENIQRLVTPPRGKITVVGDIHGHLSDLLYVIDESGLPSDTNKYVFNGDFVDRGTQGIEVLVSLLVLYIAQPSNVIINRGNHEDGIINRVYGFYDECVEKYDEEVFEVIAQMFEMMSLFAIVNDSLFIVHGGLFVDKTVKLEDLERIDRSDYVCQPLIPYPECLEGLDAEGQWKEFYRELHRNALWSDPRVEDGIDASHRGSGVLFGPDYAKSFMTTNNISMIIRSHECVQRGFYLPFGSTANPSLYSPDAPLLCTVFSASNYGDTGNEGAVMYLMDHSHTFSHAIGSTGLHYSIHRYKTSTSTLDLENSSINSLSQLIARKKNALVVAFEVIDSDSTGRVTRVQWAEVMQKVLGIKIRWLSIINSIASPSCLTSTHVEYNTFLSAFSLQSVRGRLGSDGAPIDTSSSGSKLAMDALYSQRKKLEAIFNYFDVNGDGVSRRFMSSSSCFLCFFACTSIFHPALRPRQPPLLF